MKKNSHLLEGESFTLNPQKENNTTQLVDEEINEKYQRGEIRIVTEQARYPLDTIETMLNSGKYKRNPEYQRRKRWDNVRKSRLIESFIMNVPIPPIFLYEVEYSKYEVMDGQQRLTAIYDFYTNNFRLEGLEYWQELNGRTYQELPDKVRKGVDRRYLSSIVLLSETAKTIEEADFLKKIVFERLNSGGEKLTPQETRNALYNGEFNQLCLELAKNEKFRKMWNIPLESEGENKLLESEPYRKMEDAELVLRFFACRQLDKWTSSIDKFLDVFLQEANNYNDELRENLADIFNQTVSLVYEIYQEESFYPPFKDIEYKNPTRTVYDPIMQTFSRNIKYYDILLKNKEGIKEIRYKDREVLFSGKRPLFDGRDGGRTNVQKRINYFDNLIKPFIETI